jgi:hypothetical protein
MSDPSRSLPLLGRRNDVITSNSKPIKSSRKNNEVQKVIVIPDRSGGAI